MARIRLYPILPVYTLCACSKFHCANYEYVMCLKILSYKVTAVIHCYLHVKCLQNFTKSGLDKFFRIVSTNKGRKGIEFVSMMEGNSFNYNQVRLIL